MLQQLKKDRHLSSMVKGGIWSLLFKSLASFSGLAFTVITTRYCGTDTLGILTMLTGLLQAASLFALLSIHTSVMRLVSRMQAAGNFEHVRTVLRDAVVLLLFFGAPVSVSLMLFAQPIAMFIWNSAEYTNMIRVLALLVIPSAGTMLLQDALRAMKQARSLAFSQRGAYSFAALGALLLLTASGMRTPAPLWAGFAGVVLSAIATVGLWYKVSGTLQLPKPVHGLSFRKELLLVTWPLFFTSLVVLAINYVPMLVLSRLGFAADAGIYAGIARIATFVSLPVMFMNTLAAPNFAELLHSRDKAGLQNLLQNSSLYVSLISIPVFALLVVFPQPVLALFGETFHGSRWPLFILCAGQLINAMAGSVQALMTMAGYEKAFLRICLFSLLVNVVLCLYRVPDGYVVHVAWARAASFAVTNLAGVIFILKKLGVYSFYNPFLKKEKAPSGPFPD